MENLAFTERVIARAQRISIECLFAQACTDYMIRWRRLAYDPDRNLFWVRLPNDRWQVAVWMTPAREHFEKVAA